jgi:hypothetical protein
MALDKTKNKAKELTALVKLSGTLALVAAAAEPPTFVTPGSERVGLGLVSLLVRFLHLDMAIDNDRSEHQLGVRDAKYDKTHYYDF